MRITELCNGCGLCLPYCPSDAISLVDEKGSIDDTKCVECGNCIRAAPCPVDAFFEENELVWPRSWLKYTINPSIGARGTGDECVNECTGWVLKDEVAFDIEVGRPGLTPKYEEVQKVTMAVAEVGVRFHPKASLSKLIRNLDTGELRDDILHVRSLPIEIEFKVPISKFPAVIEALKRVSRNIDTVMCIGVLSKVDPDGTIPAAKMLDEMGVWYQFRGKIDLGFGRPLRNP